MLPGNASSERVLIYVSLGRAASLLGEASLRNVTCRDVSDPHRGISKIAGMAILTDESVRTGNLAAISDWVTGQPPWSDMPFVILTARGGGVERNPSAARLSKVFGNITFLERPFHSTTLIGVAQTASHGRRPQYEARGATR